MRTIEGRKAPFLMEQFPDATDLHELARNPSELANERAKSLFETINPYNLEYNPHHENESDMQFFLRAQNLDFWDKTVTALHGSEKQYNIFLKNAALRNPGHYFSAPSVFEEVIDSKERELFIELYLIDIDNLRLHYRHLPGLASPAQLGHHANIILNYEENNSPHFDATTIMLATQYSTQPHRKKSSACKEAIARINWAETALDYENNLKNKPNQHEDNSVSFVTAYKESVKTGLLDQEVIIRSFENHKPKDDDREWKKSRYAYNEALLKFKNILPCTDSPAEILTDAFQQSAEYSVSALNVHCLLRHGLITKDDITTASQILTEQAKNNLQRKLEYHQACPYSRAYEGLEEAGHCRDEYIQQLYKEHCIEKKPITENRLVLDDNLYTLFDEIIKYRGELTDMQQELAYELLTQKDKDDEATVNVTYNWDKIASAIKDPGILSKIVTQNTANGAQVNFALWHKWGKYSGITKDEARDMFIVKAQDDPMFGVLHDIKEQLNQKTNLFTHSEMAEILQTRIKEFKTKDYDKKELIDLCFQHFGKDLSIKLIEDYDGSLPELECLYRQDDIPALLIKMDYFDLDTLIWKSPNNSALYKDSNFEAVLDMCLEVLGNEHIIDALPYFLRLMNPDQKAKLHDTMLSNPALTELFLAENCHSNHIKEFVNTNHEIAASSHEDSLALIAPKSYKSLKRRLHAKQNSKAGRDHLFSHYAYHYDLINRLGSFGDLDTAVKMLRGKNKEKNELRALELLTVLHESAGVTNFSQIENLSKIECENLATESIAHSVGLDNSASQTMVDNLRTQGIDLAKFDMWQLNSFRSNNLKEYYGPFLDHMGSGGDLLSWKFDTNLGNNITEHLNNQSLMAWKQNSEISLELNGGNQHTFKFSHDLQDVYLCGSRPSNNCLHYAFGLNQRGLVNLLSADSKMMTILNENNKPAGNAIIRIVTDKDKPSLLLEPVYDAINASFFKDELNRAAIGAAEIHAQKIGLPLVISDTSFGIITDIAEWIYKNRSKTLRTTVKTLEPKTPYTYYDTSGVGDHKRVNLQIVKEQL